MKLYEFMAKEILERHGIRIPPGQVVDTPEEAASVASRLGPVVLKAQVLAGGRGKAGGVVFATSPAEARRRAERMLGSRIQGYPVERILVEKRLDIEQELYVGIVVDGSARRPVLLASARGGVDVEEVPDAELIRRKIDVRWGLMPYRAREVALRLGLPRQLVPAFADIACRMYGAFRQYDAELVECNPLAVTPDGLVAADARLNVDDEALFRQKQLPRVHDDTPLERKVKELGLSYVQLDGDIAVMANGAGITMATIDVLQKFGGRPANFLDVGGGAAAEPMAKAMAVLLEARPRALLINIFGGITRCDDVARAVLEVRGSRPFDLPVVVRLVGTNEDEGMRLLREAGIEAYRSMEEAAAAVVRLARGEA